MKRDSQIQIKISTKEKDLLERLAKDRGLSLSELMRRGGWLLGMLDEKVFHYMEDMSKRLNVPEDAVISNTIIRRLAEDAATAEVYPCDNLLIEFPMTQQGVMIGARLFEMIRDNKLRQLKNAEGTAKSRAR